MTIVLSLYCIGLFLVFVVHFAVALVVYRRASQQWRWLALALMMVGTFVAWEAVAAPLALTVGGLFGCKEDYCAPGSRLYRTYWETVGLPNAFQVGGLSLTLVLVLLLLYGLALVRPLLLHRLAGSPLRLAVTAPVFAALAVLALVVPTVLNINATTAPFPRELPDIGAPRMLILPDRPQPQPAPHALAFSPDGQWLAVGLAPDSIQPEQPGGATVWRTVDWTVAANVDPGAGATWPVWSPDGRELVLVSGSGALAVLTTGTWAVARSWSRPGPLMGGAITPDGRTLWLAEAASLTAWSLADETPAGTIPLDAPPSSAPVIDPNGGWIAAGIGSVVGVWQLPDGTAWQRLPGDRGFSVRQLSPSPDGTTLAAGARGARVRVWRVGDGVLLVTIPDGGERAVFSPDGAYLAGASVSGRPAIYEVGSWEPRMELQSGGESSSDEAWVLAYSPDGAWLVGAASFHNMPLWPVSPPRP
jgi:hypothetical protein